MAARQFRVAKEQADTRESDTGESVDVLYGDAQFRAKGQALSRLSTSACSQALKRGAMAMPGYSGTLQGMAHIHTIADLERIPVEWNDIASTNSALSFPAKAGNPVFLGISWGYWIARSPAFAGDDTAAIPSERNPL